MSEPYFTEDAKMGYSPYPDWTPEECETIHSILLQKGYVMNCVQRVAADRIYHDAWQVQREDVPRLIEQLFRQRFTVEVQAEGHGKAAITFPYGYSGESVISAVSRFQKNKEMKE